MKSRFFLLFIVSVALGTVSCERKPSDEMLASYVRAASYFDTGKFEEAIRASDTVRDFHPAVILRGKAFFFSGNEDRAEQSFRSTLRKVPSSAEARLWLARVLRSRGKKEESLRETERLLSDDPNNIGALRLASELAVDKGDLRVGSSFLDKAAEAGAETALVFLDRSRLRWANNEREKALSDIRAALAILPPDTAAFRAAQDLEKTITETIR